MQCTNSRENIMELNLKNIHYKLQIWVDGPDPHDHELIQQFIDDYYVRGFTCNPLLVSKYKYTYRYYIISLIHQIYPFPLSVQVLSDDTEKMFNQAINFHPMGGIGGTIIVKIPITNNEGEFNLDLIKRLLERYIPVNITAVFTIEQVSSILRMLETIKKVHPTCIISIFAGRIADTGQDPCEIIKKIVYLTKDRKDVKILWASTREVYNIIQALDSGCDIITVSPEILLKTKLLGKDLTDYSLDTVRQFNEAAKKYTL